MGSLEDIGIHEDQPEKEQPVDITKLKLSELILLALGDLRECEADPAYIIDMGQWHHPGFTKCYICFAGAVIARRLGFSSKDDIIPENLPDEIAATLIALDYVRMGDVLEALSLPGTNFCRPLPADVQSNYDVPAYPPGWNVSELTKAREPNSDELIVVIQRWKLRNAFHWWMEKIAKDLDKAGY